MKWLTGLNNTFSVHTVNVTICNQLFGQIITEHKYRITRCWFHELFWFIDV